MENAYGLRERNLPTKFNIGDDITFSGYGYNCILRGNIVEIIKSDYNGLFYKIENVIICGSYESNKDNILLSVDSTNIIKSELLTLKECISVIEFISQSLRSKNNNVEKFYKIYKIIQYFKVISSHIDDEFVTMTIKIMDQEIENRIADNMTPPNEINIENKTYTNNHTTVRKTVRHSIF